MDGFETQSPRQERSSASPASPRPRLCTVLLFQLCLGPPPRPARSRSRRQSSAQLALTPSRRRSARSARAPSAPRTQRKLQEDRFQAASSSPMVTEQPLPSPLLQHRQSLPESLLQLPPHQQRPLPPSEQCRCWWCAIFSCCNFPQHEYWYGRYTWTALRRGRDADNDWIDVPIPPLSSSMR